jgi:hypothetical protein
VVMLAEQYEYVIGGDPDRDTIDLAVVEAGTGVVRAHCTDRADAEGYARLLAWAERNAPGPRVWALEGTGSFAAGLASAPVEPRMTGSTRSVLPGLRWLARCKPSPGHEGCERRCGKSS